MSPLKKNIKLFAKLLQSVGRQGRATKKQPLSPLACAQYIKQLMDEEKLDKTQVSERLGLGRQENMATNTTPSTKNINKTLIQNLFKTQNPFSKTDHPPPPLRFEM